MTEEKPIQDDLGLKDGTYVELQNRPKKPWGYPKGQPRRRKMERQKIPKEKPKEKRPRGRPKKVVEPSSPVCRPTVRAEEGGKLYSALEEQTGKTIYELFAARYLSHHLVNDLPSGEKVPCANAPMHEMICKAFREEDRCVLVAPAKFAKSTWASFVQPLTDAVLKLVDGNILLISNTGRLAEHWLALIKDEIENNVELKKVFGDLKGGVWRQDRIRLKTGIEIVSLGLNYQIRGTGWGKVVGDDMEDDEMVRSEDQRDKFSDWFDGALLGRMHPHSRLFLIGTFLHPLCKIKKMFDNAQGQYDQWKRIKFQALDEAGESTWPARWPTDVILQQRVEMGEKMFLAEKMNAPIFGESHVFDVGWIKYYDSLPQNLYIVSMTDASSSKKQEIGDYTAVTVWGKDLQTNDVYLLACIRGRWERHSKVKAMLDYNHAYHPVFNLIEGDAYGKELRDSVLHEAQLRGQYFPYRMIPPNKNKIERAQKVTDFWEKGKVYLPRKGAQRLIDELLMFPFGDYDDYVDAMSGALNFLRRQRARPKPQRQIHRTQLQPNAAGRLT